MKPWIHARNSVRYFGGKPEDYLEIHDFLDSSKEVLPDVRHRALLHNSWGCYLTEKVFGTIIINSDNKEVSVRDVAEKHIIEDVGRIPTVEQYFKGMPVHWWLGGTKEQKRYGLTTEVD